MDTPTPTSHELELALCMCTRVRCVCLAPSVPVHPPALRRVLWPLTCVRTYSVPCNGALPSRLSLPPPSPRPPRGRGTWLRANRQAQASGSRQAVVPLWLVAVMSSYPHRLHEASHSRPLACLLLVMERSASFMGVRSQQPGLRTSRARRLIPLEESRTRKYQGPWS